MTEFLKSFFGHVADKNVFDSVHAWLYFAQAIFAGINCFALVFLYFQIRLTRRHADKDYIVSAGRHADEIYGSLDSHIKEDINIIREVYSDEVESSWTDQEVSKYWYCRRFFAHVARMAAVACIPEASKEVRLYFDSWVTELEMRIDADDGPGPNGMMRRVAEKAIGSPSWNPHIRKRVAVMLKKPLPADLVAVFESMEQGGLRGWLFRFFKGGRANAGQKE